MSLSEFTKNEKVEIENDCRKYYNNNGCDMIKRYDAKRLL